MLLELVLVAAVMVLLLKLRDLPYAGHCLDCGGMGGHKKGCPRNEED